MKTVLVTLLFAASALAQASQGVVRAEAACGPLDVRFDTQTSAGQPLAQPEPGKALVYVAEEFRKAPGELGDPTIRVGLDGAWKGATRANTYLFFSVDPGAHHLCTNWQSRLKRLSRLAAFARFTAQPGKTYYFRARITYAAYGARATNMNLDLDRVNPDEGKFLVASSRLSTSHAKK
jgi:hypothetical protein